MSGRSRKLNAVEKKIHQAILSVSDTTMTQKQVDAVEPEPKQRTDAINFLLKTGLITIRTDGRGSISYKAVGKKELEQKKDLAGEEVLVLNHIQAAGNEGIWTKHLKTKTELHQTVIDRCLKSLTQKQLVKSIKNVKYPTRKIYMLFNLEPSAAITGGPWYTDSELDTEFINLLASACLKFIQERSFPKSRSDSPLLYAISATPQYPTTLQIQSFLQKSRITETELSLEHIEMLLNVLITDGEIERIPTFGAAMWHTDSADGNEGSDSEDGKKRKKKKVSSEREKKRRRKNVFRSDSESGGGEDNDADGGGGERERRDGRNSDVTKTDDDVPNGLATGDYQEANTGLDASNFGGAFVYRAVRQERVVLGWSQAPCGRCPQFDFCKDGGPVNPQQCRYYEDWLAQDIAIE